MSRERLSTSQSGLEKAARTIRQIRNAKTTLGKLPAKFRNTQEKQYSLEQIKNMLTETETKLLAALEKNNITLIQKQEKEFLELTEISENLYRQTITNL